MSSRPVLRASFYPDGHNVRWCALQNVVKHCHEGLDLEIFLTIAREAGFDIQVIVHTFIMAYSCSWLDRQHLTMACWSMAIGQVL
jgi:hypothetical protein